MTANSLQHNSNRQIQIGIVQVYFMVLNLNNGLNDSEVALKWKQLNDIGADWMIAIFQNIHIMEIKWSSSQTFQSIMSFKKFPLSFRTSHK